jgi:hypothetical protein
MQIDPHQLPSLIPAPPVLAALPPHRPRRQPAPAYERGAGQSTRSRRFLCLGRVQAATGKLDLWWVLEQRVAKESLLDRSHGGLAHGRVVRRTVDRGGTRRKPVTENAGFSLPRLRRAQLSGASSKTSAGMAGRESRRGKGESRH